MKLERIPWSGAQEPREAPLHARLAQEGFDAFSWSDPPGHGYAPHQHEHDESLWMLRGRMTFGIAGAEYVLEPGDRLMLPAGTVHSAVAGPAGAAYLIGRRNPAGRKESE